MRNEFIFYVIVLTLALVMISVVGVMLWGLFVDGIDNKDVFAIIGPAFHTIVGCFVGLLSAKWIEKKDAP